MISYRKKTNNCTHTQSSMDVYICVNYVWWMDGLMIYGWPQQPAWTAFFFLIFIIKITPPSLSSILKEFFSFFLFHFDSIYGIHSFDL